MHLLNPSDYHRVTPLLRDLPINTLFARLVTERKTEGEVLVDDPLHPRAGYVWHPYGMSLLFGSVAETSFRDGVIAHLAGETRSRSAVEWLQTYPAEWSTLLEQSLDGRIVQGEDDPSLATIPPRPGAAFLRETRVNFRFDPEHHARVARSLTLPPGCEIIDDVERIYAEMQGSVVPSTFWDDPRDLADHGSALALVCDGQIASVAFSAFTLDDEIELGVETADRFRGRGFAVHACSAMLQFCLERRLEPVWACRLGNLASYRLALRLGFEHSHSIPYYRLPPTVAMELSA